MKTSTRVVLPLVAAISAVILGATAAQGTTGAQSVYSYRLDGSASHITNRGVTAGVPLNLIGNWSAAAGSVRFDGDLVSRRSVGEARPASGPTLRVDSASQGVGAAIAFTYRAPAKGCFADSVNLTQIGRFATNLTQVKIQLSKCKDGGSTTVQCRMTGNVSSSSTLPSRNSLGLVNGVSYIAECLKGPDPGSGSATLAIRVTRVDTGQLVQTLHAIPRTGTMSSTQYLSVANKYPLPSPGSNTDQFVGEVSHVAYCTGISLDAVRGCLDTGVAG
jgi:hypothetical protein